MWEGELVSGAASSESLELRRGAASETLTQAVIGGVSWGEGAAHLRSPHETTRCNRAHPSGSRVLLDQGLLRTLKLRCSLSGRRKVTRSKYNLHQGRNRSSTTNPVRNPLTLLYAHEISHRELFIPQRVIDRSFSGTHRCAGNGNSVVRYVRSPTQPRNTAPFLKSLSAAFYVRFGAEGQQGMIPGRGGRSLPGCARNEIPLTPERRGNNRDVSTEQRRHAAAVPGTPGSYSRSDPREDARTPAGSDVAFPRSLFTPFAGVRLPSPQRLDLARVSLPAPPLQLVDGGFYSEAA